MLAPVFGDEGAVSVVQVEVPRQLLGRRVVGEAAMASDLLVGEKADRRRCGAPYDTAAGGMVFVVALPFF